MDQWNAPKLQPLTRLTVDTKTKPNDYKLILAKWDRYRDGCLKPHNHNAAAIALHLWDCCPKILQTILRSNDTDNTSTETELINQD